MPFDTIANTKISVNRIFCFLLRTKPSPKDRQNCRDHVGGSPKDRIILWNLRLPRIQVGMLVGVAMALSGAVLQGVLRNPLSDPGIIGVSAGAGLVAVAVMIIAPHCMGLIPWGAFFGALVTAVLVMGLAWGMGGLSPLRLVLAGIALNALLGALTAE
jgi:iron complex transport system permease protein